MSNYDPDNSIEAQLKKDWSGGISEWRVE